MKRNVMWQFPQLSWFQINEVRQKMNKFLRTAYPTPSNKTTGTPASARGSPPSGSWRSREEPRPAGGLALQPRPPRAQTKGGGTRAPSRDGHRTPRSQFVLPPELHCRAPPGFPRCSAGRQPHPRAPSFGPRSPRSPTLRGGERGRAGCGTRPGTGKAKRKRGHRSAASAPREERLPPTARRGETPRRPGPTHRRV